MCAAESTRSEAHAPPGRFIVPVSSNPNFAGREQELAMIDNYLSPQNDSHGPRCPIVAIFGLGGVG